MTVKVLVKTPISAYTGYGRDGIGLVQALLRCGADVYLQPTHVSPPLPPEITRLFEKPLQKPFDLVIDHEDPARLEVPSALRKEEGVTLAWSMWEYCADTCTEILTKRGWLKYDEVEIGDESLAIDPETGLSSWQTITDVFVSPSRVRDMISMETSVHSSLTTLDHRWLVKGNDGKFRWKTSETLKTGNGIPRSAPRGDFPTQRKYQDAFVELVAWTYTEGWLERGSSVRIGQSSVVNASETVRIRAALTTLYGDAVGRNNPSGGISWSESQRSDGMTIFSLSRQASLEILEAAPGKCPSFEFLSLLTEEQLSVFIEVSILADGHENRKGLFFSQNEGSRLDAFVFACALAGRAVSAPTVGASSRCKQVSVRRTDRPTYVKPMDTESKRKGAVRRVSYEGIVWCPTLKHGNWLARRNGKIYFTGNTSLENLDEKALSDMAFRMKGFDLFLGYDAVTLGSFAPYLEDTASAVLQGGYDPSTWDLMERDWFSDRFGFMMCGQLHAQPLTAKVLTPVGWKLMGDLAVGDTVIDPQGGWQKVEELSARTQAKVYRVTTSDGSVTEASAEHLWEVRRKNWRAVLQETEVVTTEQMLESGLKTSSGNWKFTIPTPQVDFEESFQPLDPYLVGVLLGDGCSSDSSMTLTCVDPTVLAEVEKTLPSGVSLRCKDDGKTWKLLGCDHTRDSTVRNLVKRGLDSIGLLGVKTPDKFVPESYLRASEAQRIAVLQGLLDTDGWVTRSGARFCSSSYSLVLGVADLVRSLGGQASVGTGKRNSYTYKGEKKTGRLSWTVVISTPFNPFRAESKRSRWSGASVQDTLARRIVSIEEVRVDTVQCIRVSGESQTYVTDDFIVTHNSRKDPFVAIQAFVDLKRKYPKDFDGAELHLKNNIRNLHPDMENWCPKLRVHYDTWPTDVLNAFYQSQHVLLAPSRGEGKNLPALEFMTTGGAVIATNWGGHTEWLDPQWAYPLDYVLREESPQYPNCKSARASTEHMKELMMHTYRNRAEVKAKADLASQMIPKMCNWDSVVEKMFYRIRDNVPEKGADVFARYQMGLRDSSFGER